MDKFTDVVHAMKDLPPFRFFALWLILAILAIATLAPLVHAVRWW